MNLFQIFHVFCGNEEDLQQVMTAKIHFPYPMVTSRIRINIVEADPQIAIKLNLLGENPSYVYRNDPNDVIVDGEAGTKLAEYSIYRNSICKS